MFMPGFVKTLATMYLQLACHSLMYNCSLKSTAVVDLAPHSAKKFSTSSLIKRPI